MSEMYNVRYFLKELEQTELFSINPSATVSEAREYMIEKDIGAVCVILDDGGLGGIFTERDGFRKSSPQLNTAYASVEKLMTPAIQVIAATLDTSLEDCFDLMDKYRVRHLPVLEDGKLVGMISMRDLVRMIVDNQVLVSQQLHSYIIRH